MQKGARALVSVVGLPTFGALRALETVVRNDDVEKISDALREELFGSGEAPFKELSDLKGIAPSRLPTGRADALPVVVVDDFYEDPDAIRAMAFRYDYVQHFPGWWVSAWESGPDASLRGAKGNRWNGAEIRDKLESILAVKIRTDTWELAGDGWNGAFHIRFGVPFLSRGGIHNHHATKGVWETEWGWTGVLYLSPELPSGSGTSIFVDKATGLCYAEEEVPSWRSLRQAKKVYEVEARYNRLVLMDSRIFHRAELGFGHGPEDARLTQTFFFDVARG